MNGVTLQDAIKTAENLGATVSWKDIPEEPGRYFGILAGHSVILYTGNSEAETIFTLAHLFGHLQQRARPTPDMYRAIGIVSPARGIGPLSDDDRELMFTHEFEAASLGLAMLDRAGTLTPEQYQHYVRMFWTDFHYLENYVETGVGGPVAFQKQWDQEVCTLPIAPDQNITQLVGTPDPLSPDIMVV